MFAEGDRISVRILGRFDVVSGSAAIALTPHQQALTAIVYVLGRVSRREAAEILWPDCQRSVARHNLRQLLHQTHSRTGFRIIATDGDALLPRVGVESDAARFRAACTPGHLLTAAKLLQRGIAQPADLPASHPYRKWAAGHQERLKNDLCARATTAWLESRRTRRWAQARDAAESLHHLAPSSVEAVSGLIEARARQGDFDLADDAYREFVTQFQPSPEIRRVLDTAVARSRRARSAACGAGQRTPFVGRSALIRRASDCLSRIAEGEPRFILLRGEAGIGKTRTLKELEGEATLRGFRCLWARPTELERRIPLNPLADALNTIPLSRHLSTIGEPWSAVVASSLPVATLVEHDADPPPIEEQHLTRRLMDAYYLLLEQVAQEMPTILLVDDLQWVDETTLAVLQFFQRRALGHQFGVIAAVRTAPGRLHRPIEGLLDPAILDVFEITDLAMPAALDLVRAIAQSAGVTSVPARRICEMAGLHPLYLTEVTRDFLAGRLALPEVPQGSIAIPLSLQQLLEPRLAPLSPDAMRLAGALSVFGKPVTPATLGAVTGLATSSVGDCMVELETAGLIRCHAQTVHISHELFRAAIYGQLSSARRLVLHKAVAGRMRQMAREDCAGELALHYAKAGERSLAARFATEAASHAWDQGAMPEAAYFFGIVVENDLDESRQAQAASRLARARHLARDRQRATPALELAATRLRSVGDDTGARRLDILRVDSLASADTSSIDQLIDRLGVTKAEARQECDWETVAMALDMELKLLGRRGDLRRIAHVFDELCETAAKGNLETQVLSHAGLAMQAIFGDPSAGLAAARRSVTVAEQASVHRLAALVRLLVVLQFQGMAFLPEALAAAEEATRLADRAGDLRSRFLLEGNRAVAMLDAGELDEAESLMELASERLGSAGLDIPRFGQPNNRAELAVARADYEEARLWYQRAADQIGPNTPHYAPWLVAAGLGICALETGDLAGARRFEAQVATARAPWCFDPTIILRFRARMLERRGLSSDAITLLDNEAILLDGRFVFAWLKLQHLLIPLLIATGQAVVARERAADAFRRSEALSLSVHGARFKRLMKALTPS